MSVPSSLEELLQLIRKSGMVDEGKLSAYTARRTAGRGLPADPRDAADAMIADGLLTNFQAEQFLLGKWRGFTIGKYKLLERVGVGGMGQVFLCEHRHMRRRVAIKVLPPAKAEQPAALGRFYREARAAGSLDHPNIVRTHDIDQDGNLHFIVMDYVDGSNLLDMVKKFGPMDIARACEYTRQVALGLDFAFNAGIIHRDVKPGNILVDRKGNAKILDMGLARFYNDQTDNLTIKYDDKIVLGTADYVAPEQVANSHSVDVRADVYALGATLYFLLAGHPPFPSGTVSQKLLWHRTKEPTAIRDLRPEIPESLAAVLAKLMAKEPGTRYQTPAAAVAALAPFCVEAFLTPKASEMPALSPAAMAALDSEPDVELSVGGSGEYAELTPEPSYLASSLPAGPFAPPASRLATKSSQFGTLPRREPSGTVPRPSYTVPTVADVAMRTPAAAPFTRPAAPTAAGDAAKTIKLVAIVALLTSVFTVVVGLACLKLVAG